MVIAAVKMVATQGQSVRDRRLNVRGSSPSSESCDSVREAPAKRLERAVEHVEHEETRSRPTWLPCQGWA